MTWIEQLAGFCLVLLGIGWSIILFFHTITFPLSEEKMREIIREELKKILVDGGLPK